MDYEKAFRELNQVVREFQIALEAGTGAAADRFLERERKRIAGSVEVEDVPIKRFQH